MRKELTKRMEVGRIYHLHEIYALMKTWCLNNCMGDWKKCVSSLLYDMRTLRHRYKYTIVKHGRALYSLEAYTC